MHHNSGYRGRGGGGPGHFNGHRQPHNSFNSAPRGRELRRPHAPSDDLSQRMAGMDPFGNAYGGYAPQPAPNLDGWSSGDAAYHQQQQQQQHDQFQQFGASGGQNNQFNSHFGGGHGGDRFTHYNSDQQFNQQQQQQYGAAAAAAAAAFQQQQAAAYQFNAGAAEFVPGSGGASNLSINASEFVPPSMPRNASQWGAGATATPGAAAYDQQDMHAHSAGPAIHWEVHPMERLTDAIATLVYQPVKIERIASEQTETLNASIGDAFTLDGAVDTIYESCMTERGFRSVGAKLCARLSNTITAREGEETFKSTLIRRCQKEQTSFYDSDRSRTFALFLAELFAEMKEKKEPHETKEGDAVDEGRNAVLADSVMTVLTMLCNEPLRNNRINLNAAADAIKISGGSLEKEEKSRSSSDATPIVDDLCAIMDEMSKSDSVDSSTKSNLAQIAELRSSGWPAQKPKTAEEEENASGGKKKSKAITLTAPDGTPLVLAKAAPADASASSEAVAKKKAGNGQQPGSGPLTSEEINFLNENIGDDEPPTPTGSEFGDTGSESGMPPEVAAAFEEFIANQN